MELYNQFIEKIFSSWTSLRIGVEHESGGPGTTQKVSLLIEKLPFVVKKLKHEDKISEFLEDYLDDELNIICEDDSVDEVAKLLRDGMLLFENKKLDELRVKIDQLPTGCNLSECQGKCDVVEVNDVEELISEEDCDDDDDEEEDYEDEEMVE